MKSLLRSGKRRTAIARAIIKEGTGRVLINGKPIEIIEPEIVKMKLMEPFYFVEEKTRHSVDIKVKVKGGGYMGQADAARTAIARALLAWTDSEELRIKYTEYDRHMIVGDPRRREPKQFGGPGARAKYTKSYR
ncbi:MAG: 30S ribosomal protein S9 [Candidatus Heimdallarchaeota archaeon]|nr:MAG: 30S ribosomal protein S9 [Candidatus Heimdallarchaeota archaeon]